jgi:hypothetical protein
MRCQRSASHPPASVPATPVPTNTVSVADPTAVGSWNRRITYSASSEASPKYVIERSTTTIVRRPNPRQSSRCSPPPSRWPGGRSAACRHGRRTARMPAITMAGMASTGVPGSLVASRTAVTTTGPSAIPALPPTENQPMACVELPAMPRAVRVISG